MKFTGLGVHARSDAVVRDIIQLITDQQRRRYAWCPAIRPPHHVRIGHVSLSAQLDRHQFRVVVVVVVKDETVVASMAIARRDKPSPWRTAVVKNTRPIATAGDDHPKPGIGVYQATFFASDHSLGVGGPVACPSEFGPRNCDQSLAISALRANSTIFIGSGP